jgi:N-acetylglucosaminyldiphosphoundecaprenol N-acetyl-beta-D-mannosaminyltransferase
VGRFDILGCTLDAVTDTGLERWLDRTVHDPWDGRCRHLVTLNPEYVMRARRDPAFASALARADLATADGVGVAIGARLIHGRVVERLTGVEIVERLAQRGESAFLLGAGPGVAAVAASRLKERFPAAKIAGLWAEGSPDPINDAETLRRIREASPEIVLVAYGAPAQVLWIDRNRDALGANGVRLAIGVGGTLDYLAGTASRPPELIRRMGLEWLYRLIREPWRWKRQLVLPVYALLVMKAAVGRRLRRSAV